MYTEAQMIEYGKMCVVKWEQDQARIHKNAAQELLQYGEVTPQVVATILPPLPVAVSEDEQL